MAEEVTVNRIQCAHLELSAGAVSQQRRLALRRSHRISHQQHKRAATRPELRPRPGYVREHYFAASCRPGLAASDALSLTRSVQALDESLTRHMRHEENEALPLVETFLGPEGWAAFGRAIRKTQGLRADAEYLPWVLDGAPIATQAKFLGLLPPPVRLLYRRVWAPRYRRIPRWDGPASG